MDKQNSIAQDRFASHVDAVGHDSVQPWSAGPIFPCVIAKVERYPAMRLYRVMVEYAVQSQVHRVYATTADVAEVRVSLYVANTKPQRVYVIGDESSEPSVSYELIAYGRREEYATREDAERVAQALNADGVLRAKWRGEFAGAFYLVGALDNLAVHDQSGVAL